MPTKRSHRKIVKGIAEALNLSDDATAWALIGSEIPDLDLYIGKHRKTLHNPALGALASLIPANDEGKVAFLLGVASHLFLDKLSKYVQASQRLYTLITKIAEA